MIRGTINHPDFYTPSDTLAAQEIARRTLSERFVEEVDVQKGVSSPDLHSAQLIVEELGINATGVDNFQRAVAEAYTNASNKERYLDSSLT